MHPINTTSIGPHSQGWRLRWTLRDEGSRVISFPFPSSHPRLVFPVLSLSLFLSVSFALSLLSPFTVDDSANLPPSPPPSPSAEQIGPVAQGTPTPIVATQTIQGESVNGCESGKKKKLGVCIYIYLYIYIQDFKFSLQPLAWWE